MKENSIHAQRVADVERRKDQFLARRVEEADQEPNNEGTTDEHVEIYEVGQQATMATSAEGRGNGVRAPEHLPDADEPDDAPSSPGEKRTMIQGLQSMIENRRTR